MTEEDTGFLEPEDVTAIGRIMKRELAKASDPEARMKASYDFDNDTDIRPANERRAHAGFIRNMLAQRGLEAEGPVSDAAAADAWEKSMDDEARELLLPDEAPRTPNRRSGDERNEACPYDYGDQI